MAGKAALIEAALDRADPSVRCYLLYGPDEAGSRALAARLAKALGEDAERIDLEPARLKADPALLADEAAAISMFGGRRHIRVEGAGDESLPAIEALFEAAAVEHPVVLIAGALRKDSRLVKRIEQDPAGRAHPSYPPEGGDAVRLARAMGQGRGLRMDAEIAARLAVSAGGDRAVLAQEIEKLALYADAAPDAPREASHAMLDAVGAESAEADLARLVQATIAGEAALLDREIQRAAGNGQEGVPVVRAVLRRLMLMASIRSEVDRGASPRTAMERAGKAVFWKEREAVTRDVAHWSSSRIATAIARLVEAERSLKSSLGPGAIAADAELFRLARAAGRR